MHCTHVVPAISEEIGGPSYSVTRLCESLIAEEVNIALATLNWTVLRHSPDFLTTFPLGYGPRKLGRSPVMSDWLVRQAATGATDLLHNHALWMMSSVYAGRAAQRFHLPLLVSPRGMLSPWGRANGSWVKKGFWPLVQRPALEATTCFHATAAVEYEEIRKAGFRQPVAIIPNGIDLPEWLPKNPALPRTLLFLGRLHPKKGLDILLRAWQAVMHRFPDWQLRIAGTSSDGYQEQLQQLAAELQLQRMEFSGALYGQEKWRAYRDAALFVLPTHSENFGIAVAEALAAGTPALVTKGAPWQPLDSYRAGWWIDVGLDALIAGLEQALPHSVADCEAMGLRGRAWMSEQFAWPQIGKMMAQTYHWMLRGGTPPEWVQAN
jgi:glycosyltransferase involved in cell wall biosynthesis